MGYEKIELEIFTFDPEDGLDALKVLEESAELQVSFKAWGGPITDETYDRDYFEEKTILKENTEDELADVIISCVNLAKSNGLDLGAGLSRKNETNKYRDELRKLMKRIKKSCC